jgi:hypothetical protein
MSRTAMENYLYWYIFKTRSLQAVSDWDMLDRINLISQIYMWTYGWLNCQLCYFAAYCEPSCCLRPSHVSGECVARAVQTREHDDTVSEHTYQRHCKYVGKADKGLTNIASGYLNAVINIWCIPVGRGVWVLELCACNVQVILHSPSLFATSEDKCTHLERNAMRTLW